MSTEQRENLDAAALGGVPAAAALDRAGQFLSAHLVGAQHATA